MTKRKQTIRRVFIALQVIAMFALWISPALSTTTLSSSNYKVIDHDFSYGGGRSTSTIYAVQSNIELVLDAKKSLPTAPGGGEPGGGGEPPPPPPPPPADTTAPVISDVHAINITTTGATITWLTNEAADSLAEYGETAVYGNSVSSSTFVSSHSLNLSGLTASTLYHFRVKSSDVAGNQAVSLDFTFTTASFVDTTAPIISNIRVINITGTSATILWDTDEASASQVKYGLTGAYGNTKTDSALETTHQIDLTGLSPDTVYHFQVISTDEKGNTSSSGDQTFKTLDTIPPVISNIQVTNITDRTADVSWVTNEATTSEIFYRRAGETAYSSISDVNLTVSHFVGLSGLIANVSYEFYIAAKDAAGNTATSSIGTFKTLPDNIPPANIQNFTATPDDGLNVLTWQNPANPDYAGVYIVRSSSTYPQNKFDGDFVYVGSGVSVTDSGLINGVLYYYTGFAYDTSLNYASGAITRGMPTGPLPPEEEIKPPVVPPTVNLDAVSFYVANRAIQIYADASGIVETLSGVGFGVSVLKNKLPADVKILTLRVENSNYLMKLRADGSAYDADVVLPAAPSSYKGEITLVFENSQQIISFGLDLKSKGIIFEKEAGIVKPVGGAAITLYELKNNVWQIWQGSIYYQDNPFITVGDGTYGFLVQNGTYYLKITKDGYRDNITNRFDVEKNYINQSLEFLLKPKKLIEIIKPEAPITENIGAVAKNIAEKTAYTSKIAQEEIVGFVQNPVVEQITSGIAAPSLVSVAVFNAATALPFLNLWTYLQYLLTQPLLFLKRKKRKAWGMVYNGFTKLPLDLAIVRLLDAKTKRILRTAVTDKQGRFILFAPQGNFSMGSTKPGFIFPSVYLKGKKEDEAYVDLYHGTPFEVKQDGQAIIYNLPMDPIGKDISTRRLIATRALKGLQYGLSLSGIVLTTVSLIIAPSIKIGLFLLLHIALFGLFTRLAKPPKFKKWGVVTDAATGKPVKNAIVRLFEPEYNKLLGTQITDAKGRYGFLVGRNIFYLTVEKAGYKQVKTRKIDTRTKGKAGVITEKVKLEKT